jgi:hypothetical protein
VGDVRLVPDGDILPKSSLSTMAQERECCRELVMSIGLEYFSMAHDYAIEVPIQNFLNRLSRRFPISNSSKPNETMRTKLSNIP